MMVTVRSTFIVLRLAVCLLMASLAAPSLASATTYTWTGATSSAWNDATNWTPQMGAPAGFPNGLNDIAVVNGGGTPISIAISNTTPITLQRLFVNGSTATITIIGLASTLTLVPLDGVPGLECVGALVIQVPVFLSRDTIVRTAAGATLTFLKPINDTESPKSLLKKGAGQMRFSPDTANGYGGTTTVEQGTLVLVTRNTIADTAAVVVMPGALLTTQQHEEMGELTIVEGAVDISAGGDGYLAVTGLHMIGGTIRSDLGGRILYLLGNMTATSSPTQIPAAIEASVRVDLFDATRTITVLEGPGNVELEIRAAIGADHHANSGVIKDGPGVMTFPNLGATNDYQGLTWVKKGHLHAYRKISNGDLRIGDGVGTAEFDAQVTNLTPDAIGDTRSVTIEADGSLSETNAETIDQLTLNGGSLYCGGLIGGGSLALRVLVMNGGLVDLSGGIGGSSLIVNDLPNARIEATSTATQTPTIRGDLASLVLLPKPDLIVNDGPQAIDLNIDSRIFSSLKRGLRKAGLGVARFAKDSTYEGPTTVDAGTLLIDGSQPSSPVSVAAAVLGGRGTTGAITATAGATIAPGASAGILRSGGNVQLAAGATFAVEVNGTTAGTAYDQLRVTGTVALANATLGLTIGPGVSLPVDAKFTIVDNDGTDAIVGTFANLAEGAIVIADRFTFTVSYHGGDGNDVVLTTTTIAPDVLSYYLAEGATGSFFDEDVLIANPNDTDAPVTLTFLQEGGGTIVEHRTVPKQARLTVHVDQIAGLENASPSVQVVSDLKLPLIAERSMFWDASYYGGHTANAVAKPERKWIFAEGFQGFFDTYLLIANANAVETTATVTFLRENDTPVVKTFPIGAFARKTIYAGDVSELIGRAFGMVVESTQPVIAERSMYFASIPNRLWTGGHVNTGVNAPSTSWFHAEGATGGFFNTFILLSNPQTSDAHVDLRFLLEDGTTVVKNKTLPAGQRLTVNPAAEDDPRLTNAAMSTVVASDVPIVSERSMYWPGDATPFGEGHNSSGVVATATRWGLAEGRVGSPRHFTTYILLANPTTTAAQVTVTYLRENGAAPVTKTYSVPPTSRFNIDVASAVPELRDESFGARIEVTNGVAIAVERSLYWDANGIFWAGGTNALGTPLP